MQCESYYFSDRFCIGPPHFFYRRFLCGFCESSKQLRADARARDLRPQFLCPMRLVPSSAAVQIAKLSDVSDLLWRQYLRLHRLKLLPFGCRDGICSAVDRHAWYFPQPTISTHMICISICGRQSYLRPASFQTISENSLLRQRKLKEIAESQG